MRTKIILILILAIAIGVGYLKSEGVPKTFAAVEDFENPAICLGEAIVLYHERVNDVFNKNIDLFLKGKEGKDYTLAPPGIDPKTQKRFECADNNISTYCTALKATDLYRRLLGSLDVHAQRVDEAQTNLDPKQKTFGEGIAALNYRREIIDNEIQNAKKTLDLALASYNEFRMAYPLHQRLTKTFNHLQKYKQALWGINIETTVYPTKFIDVNTAKCS